MPESQADMRRQTDRYLAKAGATIWQAAFQSKNNDGDPVAVLLDPGAFRGPLRSIALELLAEADVPTEGSLGLSVWPLDGVVEAFGRFRVEFGPKARLALTNLRDNEMGIPTVAIFETGWLFTSCVPEGDRTVKQTAATRIPSSRLVSPF